MSHVTTIDTVPIKDIDAVKKAVKELKKLGVSCELLKDSRPRMYFNSHEELCDYVIKLNESPYDIGLRRKEDEGKFKEYELIFDGYKNHICKLVGYTDKKQDEDKHLRHVGQFTKLYSKHATINQAKKQGYRVTTKQNKDGSLNLVLTK